MNFVVAMNVHTEKHKQKLYGTVCVCVLCTTVVPGIKIFVLMGV